MDPSMSMPISMPMPGTMPYMPIPAHILTQAQSSMNQNSNSEHLLETPWSFYYDKKMPAASPNNNTATTTTTTTTGTTPVTVPSTTTATDALKAYEQNLHKIGTCNSIESFYHYYSYLTPPASLPRDYNIFLFRASAGIPAWESFPTGGCWIIKVRKRNGVINRLWEELVFSCIGEWFEEPDIAGVALSTRTRDDVISIWNKNLNSHSDHTRLMIGEKLREILNLDESTQVEYKYFKSAIADGSTHRNAKPYIYAAAPAQGQYQQY